MNLLTESASPSRMASQLLLRRTPAFAPIGGDVLDQTVLSYAPVFDRDHRVFATRLSVLPLMRAIRLDAAELMSLVVQVWPAASADRVWLNVAFNEQLLRDVMKQPLPPNVMIEVPAFMAVDPEEFRGLIKLHERGVGLVVKDRPLTQLPSQVLRLFHYAIIDAAEERRDEGGEASAARRHQRRIGFVYAGVRDLEDAQAAYSRGAQGILGWPPQAMYSLDAARDLSRAPEEARVLVEAMGRLASGEDFERIDKVLRYHPQLLHRLMHYMKSAAVGLPLGVTTLRAAVMMLGYQRLMRCMALALVAASAGSLAHPLGFAAVRRALLLERLAGDDEHARHEMFVCGALSLLDRTLGVPFADLFKRLSVPEGVYLALTSGTGPYAQYCRLMDLIECGDRGLLCEQLQATRVGPGEVNHALLRSLAVAASLA